MKRTLILLIVLGCFYSPTFAQDTVAAKPDFIHITTVESILGGGVGRSKMIITKTDGSSEEKEMNNLFSLVGINFKNIKQNEVNIITTLKGYTDEGWKLLSVTPLTLSPSQSENGIFLTRYLLGKTNGK